MWRSSSQRCDRFPGTWRLDRIDPRLETEPLPERGQQLGETRHHGDPPDVQPLPIHQNTLQTRRPCESQREQRARYLLGGASAERLPAKRPRDRTELPITGNNASSGSWDALTNY